MFCSVGVDVHDPLVQHVRFCDHFNCHNCKCIYNFLFFNDSLFSRHFYSCFNVVLYKIAVSILTRCAVFWVFLFIRKKKMNFLFLTVKKWQKIKWFCFVFFHSLLILSYLGDSWTGKDIFLRAAVSKFGVNFQPIVQSMLHISSITSLIWLVGLSTQ